MKTPGRISELDGVRGIAVLLVVFYHAILYNPGSSDDRIAKIEPFGHAGVDLFFVLSGFLITGILLNAKGKPRYFRNFYAKRALRIWPLYYMLLFIAFALVPLLAHYAHFAIGEAANIQSRSKLVYILLLQNLWYSLPYSPTLLAMTWSLSIEEQFYILWPGLVLVSTRKTLGIILAAIIMATPLLRLWGSWHGFDDEALYRVTLFRLDGLSLGALGSLWYSSGSFSLRAAKWLALAAIALGLAALPLAPPSTVDSLICLVCFGVVLFAIWCSLTNSVAGGAFRAHWLRYVGKVSYCLYLVHQPVYYALAGLARKYGEGNHLVNFLVIVLGLVVSLGIASVSWYFFESQLLTLTQRFQSRVRPA